MPTISAEKLDPGDHFISLEEQVEENRGRILVAGESFSAGHFYAKDLLSGKTRLIPYLAKVRRIKQ